VTPHTARPCTLWRFTVRLLPLRLPRPGHVLARPRLLLTGGGERNNAGWGTEFPSILTALYFGGANLNAGDQSLNTPLHLAAFEGHVQTINELVKYGAKLDRANLWQQRTPLGMAILVGAQTVWTAGACRAVLTRCVPAGWRGQRGSSAASSPHGDRRGCRRDDYGDEWLCGRQASPVLQYSQVQLRPIQPGTRRQCLGMLPEQPLHAGAACGRATATRPARAWRTAQPHPGHLRVMTTARGSGGRPAFDRLPHILQAPAPTVQKSPGSISRRR